MRVLLNTGIAAVIAVAMTLGLALPASADILPLVNDETSLLSKSEVVQLNHVLTATGEKYGVHLSVTMLKRLPAGQSLKVAARSAAAQVPLSVQARRTQIALLYVRHGSAAYTVLGTEAAKKITPGQADDIWRNQIHTRFHNQDYYQGLRKGMTLLAASFIGLSEAAFTQPAPTAAQNAVLNAHGWTGVKLSLGLIALVIFISAALAVWLRVRRARTPFEAEEEAA